MSADASQTLRYLDPPTASVVRFSSPISAAPPQARSSHGIDHHIVDVGDSAPGYSTRFSNSPSHRNRALNFLRQVFHYIWIVVFCIGLPVLYRDRVLQVTLSLQAQPTSDEDTDTDTDDVDYAKTLRRGRIKQAYSEDSFNVFSDAGDFGIWATLVQDLLNEWKMTAVASTLLLLTTLSLLQLTPSDPITRTGCILAFICAAVSVLCSVVCMIRFSGVRIMNRAVGWMEKSLQKDQSLWWNRWMALSTPLAWLIWSIILLFASAMSFTWRSTPDSSLASLGGSVSDVALSSRATLGIRIGVSALLGLGIFSAILTYVTFDVVGGSDTSHIQVHRTGRERSRTTVIRTDIQTEDSRPEIQPMVSPVTAQGTFVGSSQEPSNKRNVDVPIAFPSRSATDDDVRNSDVPFISTSVPGPHNSTPQTQPYIFPSTSAQASRSDSNLPTRHGKGKRTISAPQAIPRQSTATASSNGSASPRGSRDVSRLAAVASSRHAGSGSGSRSGQSSQPTAQRHSVSHRTSGSDVSRPRRQSRTNSGVQSRTGKSSRSGRR